MSDHPRSLPAQVLSARLAASAVATVATLAVAAGLGGVSSGIGAVQAVGRAITTARAGSTHSIPAQDDTLLNDDFLIGVGPAAGNSIAPTGSLRATVRLISGPGGAAVSVSSWRSTVSPATPALTVELPATLVASSTTSITVRADQAPPGTYTVTISATADRGLVRTSSFVIHVT